MPQMGYRAAASPGNQSPTPRPQLPTSADVKAEAKRLGFLLCGIAPADRFAGAEARYVEWVRRGWHGEMGWIDAQRARRSCRPDELLPGATSFIVVGAPYSAGREPPPPPLHGRVARYSRGRDYHDVLKERLWALVGFLRELVPDLRARLFVDTSPLAEREAAVRAGLGFYGKNTCLLAPGAGSYVLLGAILTDLPLEPDSPLVRDCGSCRLCLDACPTGALVGPYQLDARRCISYLTIELRGPIPPDLRPKLGAHLFGCDVCQEVCPWNHGRGPIPWPEFTGNDESAHPPSPAHGSGAADKGAHPLSRAWERGPGGEGATPIPLRGDRGAGNPPLPLGEGGGEGVPPSGSPFSLLLPDLLALGDEAFRRRFKGSPIKRAKRRGLLRNAAVALGNGGDRRAVPALARALAEDPEPLVRAHAAWALRRLGGPQAEAALASAIETETNPDVRAELLADGEVGR